MDPGTSPSRQGVASNNPRAGAKAGCKRSAANAEQGRRNRAWTRDGIIIQVLRRCVIRTDVIVIGLVLSFLAETSRPLRASPAKPCQFPAAAWATQAPYVSGKTERDAAVNTGVAMALGPRAWHFVPAVRSMKVLAMLSPAIWMARDHDAIAAAYHKLWPKASVGAYVDPSNPNAPWLAQIQLRSGTLWASGRDFINAPSLGGVLKAGPTSCMVRAAKTYAVMLASLVRGSTFSRHAQRN